MTNSPPLDGVRVLDLTQILAGPFCTMLLADMGADVIKIEKPDGGDDTRRMGPPFIGGESAAFLVTNRNKRSIVVDLKREEGKRVFHRMAKDADVLVQNLSPGTLERMGLGYEDLRELNPALIYCTISGFGGTGPYKHRRGFDLVTQGMSGLMSITGLPDSPPLKISVPVTDLNSGMYGAYGVLCAYINRLKTGKGQHVDSSMLDAGIAYTFWESAVYFTTGEVPKPVGSTHRLLAPYQPFHTSDGYINVACANQATWERMCGAINRQDLLEDPRFATNADRVQNLAEMLEPLTETFAQESSDHWLEILEKAGVPSGPIYNMAEVYSNPQVLARDMVVEMEHPTAGRVRNIGIPVKLSETPGSVRRPAPTLGQHTEEVLTEFGYSGEDIAGFKNSGVVA